MKRILLLFLLALTAGAGAKSYTTTVETPVGLVIGFAGVHDPTGVAVASGGEKLDADSECYAMGDFHHGNLTVRMRVDNPTAIPQPLAVEFPVRIGRETMRLGRCPECCCAITRVIPPGRGHTFDFVLPHVGKMRCLSGAGEGWRFRDASGVTVGGENLLLECRQRTFAMPHGCRQPRNPKLPVCRPAEFRDYAVAISPNFHGVTQLVKRVSSFEDKHHRCHQRHLYCHRPDFTRFRDWRDLACYDAVVFATNDWTACTEEFRECVRDYEAAGGKVEFAGRESEIDVGRFLGDLESVGRALCGYGEGSLYRSDNEAMDCVDGLIDATPFRGIVLVLLAFAIVAGPVTILILAKRGRRIHLLWVFPAVAIVFSVAVAFTIVFTNGLSVKVRTFVCEERAEPGRKIVVKNRVFVAPFPMRDAIRCSKTALVTVDSGSDQIAGERIVSTPEDLRLVGNWTPCLWPVRVREVEVVRSERMVEK